MISLPVIHPPTNQTSTASPNELLFSIQIRVDKDCGQGLRFTVQAKSNGIYIYIFAVVSYMVASICQACQLDGGKCNYEIAFGLLPQPSLLHPFLINSTYPNGQDLRSVFVWPRRPCCSNLSCVAGTTSAAVYSVYSN